MGKLVEPLAIFLWFDTAQPCRDGSALLKCKSSHSCTFHITFCLRRQVSSQTHPAYNQSLTPRSHHYYYLCERTAAAFVEERGFGKPLGVQWILLDLNILCTITRESKRYLFILEDARLLVETTCSFPASPIVLATVRSRIEAVGCTQQQQLRSSTIHIKPRYQPSF